jgi:hypothetical protein
LDQLQGPLARFRGGIGHSMGGQQIRPEMISAKIKRGQVGNYRTIIAPPKAAFLWIIQKAVGAVPVS